MKKKYQSIATYYKILLLILKVKTHIIKFPNINLNVKILLYLKFTQNFEPQHLFMIHSKSNRYTKIFVVTEIPATHIFTNPKPSPKIQTTNKLNVRKTNNI